MIMLLLLLAVVLYFVSTDRRYLLAVLVATVIEGLTLSLMWLFSLPSIVGYILGCVIFALLLISLLLREDRKMQQHAQAQPIYLEHTPVYEHQEQSHLAKK